MQTSIVSGPNFQEGGGGQKPLHLSRGILRNGTDVKWHSVGSTMTSTVGEVTQTYTCLKQQAQSLVLKVRRCELGFSFYSSSMYCLRRYRNDLISCPGINF